MSRVSRILVSVYVWVAWFCLVTAWTFLMIAVFLATAWWDRRRWWAGRTFRLCARAALALHPLWSVRVEGRLPEDVGPPWVVVCNHQSLADVVVIGSLPMEAKWISKVAILRIPQMGLMMRMAGDVGVRRRDEESRKQAFEQLRQWLLRGVSVMIFPEGTRSPDGELLPFRNGAFRLAVETETPVLPLVVSGTREAIRKGSLLFGRARARLVILDPIPVRGEGPEEVERLREEARARIAETLRRQREERAAGVPGGTSGRSGDPEAQPSDRREPSDPPPPPDPMDPPDPRG